MILVQLKSRVSNWDVFISQYLCLRFLGRKAIIFWKTVNHLKFQGGFQNKVMKILKEEYQVGFQHRWPQIPIILWSAGSAKTSTPSVHWWPSLINFTWAEVTAEIIIVSLLEFIGRFSHWRWVELYNVFNPIFPHVRQPVAVIRFLHITEKVNDTYCTCSDTIISLSLSPSYTLLALASNVTIYLQSYLRNLSNCYVCYKCVTH